MFSYQTATNVSEYNITALMHEIMTGEKYVQPKIEEKEGKQEKATLQEITEEEEETTEEGKSTGEKDTPEESLHQTQGK